MSERMISVVTGLVIAIVVGGIFYWTVGTTYYSKFMHVTVITMKDGTKVTNLANGGNLSPASSDVESYRYVKQFQSVTTVAAGRTEDGVNAEFKFALPFSFRTEQSVTNPEIEQGIADLQNELSKAMAGRVPKMHWERYKYDSTGMYNMERIEPLKLAINKLGVHWDGTIYVTPLTGAAQ